MRAAIYARVSTKDQSCDMQMRDLRAYCAARGFTISREYIDIGQSGAKDSRPELNELMADARKRKFDAILVWRFDRFARSTKHLLLALEEFRSLGKEPTGKAAIVFGNLGTGTDPGDLNGGNAKEPPLLRWMITAEEIYP